MASKVKEAYRPNMLLVMQEINSGTKKVEDVDWKQELTNMVEFWNHIPSKTPTILWMWGLLGIIKDHEVRLSILEAISSIHYRCTKLTEGMDDFHIACKSLKNLYERMKDYNKQNKDPLLLKYEKFDILKDLANIMSDDALEGYDLVALAGEIYFNDIRHEDNPRLQTVLEAFYHSEVIGADDICSFISYLFIAEGYRQLVINGNIDAKDLPKIKNLPRKVKKKCLDAYIDKRIEFYRGMLDRDEKRIKDPTEIECYEKLLNHETLFVKMLRASKGKSEPYPNRETVLELSEQFLKYLEDQINELKKMADMKDLLGAKTVNVAMGDNVMNKFEKNDK